MQRTAQGIEIIGGPVTITLLTICGPVCPLPLSQWAKQSPGSRSFRLKSNFVGKATENIAYSQFCMDMEYRVCYTYH